MSNPPRVLVVTGRHRPHEVLLLGLSVLVGIAYSFGAPPPTSVASLMPAWQVRMWAAALLVSGVVGLASLVGSLRWLERRLRLEQTAMLIGAAGLVQSTSATIWYAAGRGLLAQALLSAGFGAAWTAANLVRAWQIWRELRALRR